jgi:hypothetical protein
MSEGPDKVKQAVRSAKQSGIFMVFIIVDNPESKVSHIKTLLIVTLGNWCIEIRFYICTNILWKIRHFKILCHGGTILYSPAVCVIIVTWEVGNVLNQSLIKP